MSAPTTPSPTAPAAQPAAGAPNTASAPASGAPAASAAPAAPAVNTPRVLGASDMDALFEGKVDGKTIREPVRKAIESYQTITAAEKRLQQANELLRQSQQQIAFAKRMESLIHNDPQSAVREIARLAGVPANGHASPQKNTPSQSSGDADDPSSTSPDPRIDALMEKLERIENRESVRETSNEIHRHLDAYTIYQGADGRDDRAEAAVLVAAYRVQYPDVPLEQLVAQVHARDVRRLERAASQVRNTRAENANANPSLPASGIPALTPVGAPLTKDSFKKGEHANFLQTMGGLLQRALK